MKDKKSFENVMAKKMPSSCMRKYRAATFSPNHFPQLDPT